MAIRRRTIQPSIWQDADFGALSPLAQLIFIGMITQADDEGRLNGHPAIVGSSLFPYRTVGLEEILDAMNEIDRRMHNVLFYENENQMFIQFKSWEKHQTIREDRMQKSLYPSPPKDNFADNVGQCRTNAAQVREVSKGSKGSKTAPSGGGMAAGAERIDGPIERLRAELEQKGIIKKKTLV